MKYAQLIKDLRAKNLSEDRIKEAVLEKSKTEIQNFNFRFKSFKVKEDTGAEAGKTIEIEGYASTNDIDRYGDIVNPMAFEDTVKQFMTNPVMLLQHDHNKRIGDFTELTIDENGLYVKGDVKYTAWDPELFDKIENKSLKGFSIGFRVLEAEFQDITDEKGNVIDWVFVINKLDLIEISVVNVPANPFTLMKSIVSLATKSIESAIKEMEKEEEDQEEETPEDLSGDNANENDDENDNQDDGDEEKEKEIKVEIDKDGEADQDEEDAENEEEEDAGDEKGEEAEEEKELDGEDENDNIDNEDVDVENPEEDTDGEEEADEDDEEEKSITTKMIEKIVEAKTSGNKKEIKRVVEMEVKNLSEKFEKNLKAVKSELEKELDAMVELVKEIKTTEQEIVDRLKSTVKGKGFINLQSTQEKEQKSDRLKKILTGVKKTY